MTITLEAIRAAGGIVHSDGNIFFRDISMLQGLAGAAPAAVPVPQGEWGIDTSAGREILVYKGCSVIEDADARYVLSLIAAASQPAAVAGPASVAKFTDESTAAPVEKARRYLKAMAEEAPNSVYFFDDGYPRRASSLDAQATLAVLEQLASTAAAALEAPAAPVPEWLRSLEWAVGGYDRAGDGRSWCPRCGGCQTDYRDGEAGHKDGCELAAVLAAAPQAPAAPSPNRYCRLNMCVPTDAKHDSCCSSAAGLAAPVAPAVDAFTHAELLEIKRAVEEFADCNETDVDYALLLRAAQAGYLECTQFHVLNQAALDLDTVAAAQTKEGGA